MKDKNRKFKYMKERETEKCMKKNFKRTEQ